MDNTLKLTGVSKEYRTARGSEVVAIRDVELEIKDGEFFCLLGPSGCGKSTLLAMVAGLTAPSSGSILYGDQPITGPSVKRTMVFQQYALFPWLHVRTNVEFGLKCLGIDAKTRRVRVNELLELVGLEEFADKYPRELSGGMQQRVAFARGLAPEPGVLLLDEPFAALDLLTRELLQEEVRRLQRNTKKTFVLVTHSVDEAVFVGDRVAVMSSRPGRIKKVIDIDLPDQRNYELRTESPAFREHRSQIAEMLRQEVVSSWNGRAARREAPREAQEPV